jgi:hypothetical protein
MATDWKRKLAAYLHDPPSKCLDIKTHEERSESALTQAGFTKEEISNYLKDPDWAASAADRLPFPFSKAAGLQCAFDGVRSGFIHPLGHPEGKKLCLQFHKEFPSAELGIEGETSVQPCLDEKSLQNFKTDEEKWRARFFAHWRLWQKNAIEKDYRLGFLPADTRIPDHTIWTHIQICSAFAGCMEGDKLKPAFLKFQIGPVQDFIAAARSIRDLWSGSYLLSWLIAAGLKSLSEEVGPDSVIYPNLYGQPLFDLHWRDELWSKVNIGSKSVWESFEYKEEDLLTPNLPNVFLALVPQGVAEKLADKVKNSIKEEWRRIAKAVWNVCEEAGLMDDEGGITKQSRKEKFSAQVEKFLSISYQITPWSETIKEAIDLAECFDKKMPIQIARDRVENIIKMATEQMPLNHRDRRFYTDNLKRELNNIGVAWSIFVAYNGWCLDAVRHTREFTSASGGWEVGVFNNKDSLTGREEAVAGGRVWKERCDILAGRIGGSQRDVKYGEIGSLFRHDDWLCASTLIKRIWHLAYLSKSPWNLKTSARYFKMPNTYGIAAHTPFKDCGDDNTADDVKMEEKYFAVLSLDGDEIGKWISGEKTPKFIYQLADYTDGSGNRSGALEYFTRYENPDGKGGLRTRFESFLNTQRPLSPSYHLQFSGALSNFALYCVKPIVEVFDGRLIYAGGDDVLAILPFDTAIPCAQALRMAFRGDANLKNFLTKYAQALSQRHKKEKTQQPYFQKLAAEETLIDTYSEGFLKRLDYTDYSDKPIPFIVPGPAADCSVGVAIAHYKAPLQDVVKEAKAAEKRAKKELNKSAIAITLCKRSGEILKWGCKWDSSGLELLARIAAAIDSKKLSVRFPHKICEFLEKYLADVTKLSKSSGLIERCEEFEESVLDIVKADFALALKRQSFLKGKEAEELKEDILSWLNLYLNNLKDYHDRSKLSLSEFICKDVIGLCQTIAFTYRAGETIVELDREEIDLENQTITQPTGNL